ncbi:MAG: hypothetical protein CVU43_08175 [Chloroflexi bacterium HGW-Chloroflexi-5]|nr:MAG: hypothetical protein CVU43_08175 [Chloroflexi bacterium HGW-Chloroflexi-5]
MVLQKSALPISVVVLIWLQVLLGFGAIVSGALMMISPDGKLMQLPLFLIESSPFKGFFIPGLILFVFVGIFPSCVAYGLWKRPGWKWPDVINPFRGIHWSWAGSLASAAIVIIWLTVELIWVEIGFLHYLYYGWSGLIILFTLLSSTRMVYQKVKTN